jgi:hypothetical protein
MGCAGKSAPLLAVILLGAIVVGCGGGSVSRDIQPPPPPPSPADFSLSVSATTVGVVQGATSAPVTISVTGANGFSGSVQITLAGVPAGVASNPASPFNVTAGENQSVVFGAASSAALGTFDLTVQGSSGSLAHSASLKLTINPAPPTNLPKTGYARTDAIPASDAPGGEPRRRHIVYDSGRKRLYVANRAMNRVEVFSTIDQARVGQISVPAPTSVDLSADAKTLWVGTEIRQIVAADPATLEVTQRFVISGLTPVPPPAFDQPVDVAALSSGKLLVRLRRSGATTSLPALWDPATNALTDLTPQAPAVVPARGVGVMARSADHTRVLIAANDPSGAVAVFGGDGNLLSGPQSVGTGAIPLAAANPDGTRFAVFLEAGANSLVLLLDASLNPISVRGVTTLHGMTFSRDGQTLFVSEFDDLPPLISMLDAVDLQLIGQAPDVRTSGRRSEIEDVDEAGMLFGLAGRGVSFLDTAKAVASLPLPALVLAAAPSVTPSEGPATGGTATTIAGQDFEASAQVTFGNQAGTNVSVASGTQLQATSPPNAFGAPVNLTAYFPSGWLALAPDAFSYGPHVLEILPNAVKKTGGDVIEVLGYGFGGDASKIRVTLGGAAATVQKVESFSAIAPSLGLGSDYPFPLERITLQAPSGLPGKAHLTIASPAGTVTASHAVQFLADVQTFPQPGFFKFVSYDAQRKRVYLSDIDQIEVFDVVAAKFTAPLTLPGGPPPPTQLRGMGMTPDGKQLVVADFGGQNVYLLDPDAAGSGSKVFVGGVTGFQNSGPVRVAATSTGKVFVGMSGEGANTCSQCLGELDLATQTVQVAPQPDVSTLTGAPLVEGTATGERVFLAFGASPGGPVAAWNAATDRFDSANGTTMAGDLTAAADGTSFATGGASGAADGPRIWDAHLALLLRPGLAERQMLAGYTTVPGLALHPSGALLYRPFLTGPPGSPGVRGGVDILNAHSGVLKARVYLSEPLMTDVDGLHGSFFTTDDNGKKLFAITTSGLSVVELASVPVGIGTVSPSSGPAAGGAVFTIRGSGFQPGVTVTIGGTNASVTFVDANTLKVTAPAMGAGPKRVVVTNPDGENDALDAAFTAK